MMGVEEGKEKANSERKSCRKVNSEILIMGSATHV